MNHSGFDIPFLTEYLSCSNIKSISRRILFVLMMPFIGHVYGQPEEIGRKLTEAASYLAEASQNLQDMQENIRKAQNSAYVQDIDLYLDIAMVHFEQFYTNISHTRSHYLDIFELAKDSAWLNLRYQAGKTYNRLLNIETEISRINDQIQELNGSGIMAEIQQKLGFIRNYVENIFIELPLCIKECKEQSESVFKNDE